MPAEITVPVFMRLGRESAEVQVGEVRFPVTAGDDAEGVTPTIDRPALAALLRATADEIENPSEDDEEATDAAP